MSENVCRLCTGTGDSLMCVFDKRMPSNMAEIIRVTTGVKICRSDKITQMVCDTCYKITLRMYHFRIKSIKHDKNLKAKYTAAITAVSTPNSENSVEILPQPIMKSLSTKCQFVHPSVKEVQLKYPKLIVPQNCLKLHIGAYITLQTDEVDKWFKEKNLSDDEIAAIKQEAGKRALAEEQFNRETKSRKRKRITQESREITEKALKFVNTSVEPKLVSSSASVDSITKKIVPLSENFGVRLARKNIQVNNSNSARNVISKNAVLKEKMSVYNKPSVKNKNKTVLSSLHRKRKNLKQTKNNLTLVPLLKSKETANKETEDDVLKIRSINISPPSTSGTLRKISVDKPPRLSNSKTAKIAHPAKIDQTKDTTNEINRNDDTNVLVIDSASLSNLTNLSTTTTDKETFIKALNLVPKQNILSNTCKGCDAAQPSLRKLRYHKKKMCTKCPVKLIPCKIETVRVDKIEKIRKKCASAFEVLDEKNVSSQKQTDVPREITKTGIFHERNNDDKNRLAICDSVITDDTKKLENFINTTKDIQDKKVSKTIEKDENKCDAICISGDKTDPQLQNSNKKMIKILNDETLKIIDVKKNNLIIRKQILQFSKHNHSNTKNLPWSLVANPISNGDNKQVKVFKNLHQEQNKFKIPVQIKNGSQISARYIANQSPESKKLNDLRYNATLKKLQKKNCSTKNEEKKRDYSMVNSQALNHTSTALQQTSNTVVYQTNSPNIMYSKGSESFLTSIPSSFKTTTLPARLFVSNTLPSQPIVLNNAINMCKNDNNNFVNFKVVSSNLVTLPVTGATETINKSLPLNAVDSLRSNTDSLMPPSSENDKWVQKKQIVVEETKTVSKENVIVEESKFHSAIRVKDFKELC